MDEFRTIAKVWPVGTELDLGTDSNILGGPATFTRNAANFVTSPDGMQNYQFLFWNTGRHMTNKRRVRWNFSVLGWGTWTATRWYGTPSTGGSGPARVRVDAFSIGGDTKLNGSPIDGVLSTYASGAWPFNGDDHVIGTAAGAANVIAKDPFNNYDFAGFLQLIWGGDPTGEFVESDAGTSGSIGGGGFFDHVTGTSFAAAKGTSADLLAAYGFYDKPGGWGPLPEWFYEVFQPERGPEIPDRGDPGPIDFIRLRILEQIVQKTRPGSRGGTDFESLVKAAPNMNKEQLKRALQSIRTSLDMGKAALSAIEAQLKKK